MSIPPGQDITLNLRPDMRSWIFSPMDHLRTHIILILFKFEFLKNQLSDMKYNKSFFLCFLLIPLFTIHLFAQKVTVEPERKTLFVIMDGISDDVIKEVETPHLDDIASEGAFLHAYVGGEPGTYSETPTISAVGYNSLLTGTWVNKLNVWGNAIHDPNYNYWTLFRLLKHQDPSKKAAIFSTWLDNRTKLIGTGLASTNGLELDYSFDGFEHDTLAFPHDSETVYIRDIDDFVTDEAADYIETHGPDMSWVYLQFTDNMGHMYGDHPKFHESIRHMDGQVGRIWEAVREREKNHNEEWLVIITTDHGRSADTGKGHGGQSERGRSTWIVTNADQINDYGKDNRVAVTDIVSSINEFMGLSLPRHRAMEVDGVPFLGKVDAFDLKSQRTGDKIRLSWAALAEGEKCRVWFTPTNHFKEGGEDLYYYAGEVDLGDEEFEFSVKEMPSQFYKIVLETPNHWLNSWIVEE